MLQWLFVLKKNDVRMAHGEVEALDPGRDVVQYGHLLIRKPGRDLSKRLALTRSIHEVVFVCEESRVREAVEGFEWGAAPASFYVDVHGSKEWTNAGLGQCIGARWGHPAVDSKSPVLRLDVFFDEGTCVVAKNAVCIDHDFEARRAHLRPAHHPSSLHPMFARALVNLTGVWSGTLVDPMCGAGGFLIEAGLMGVQCKGFDIDAAMLERCQLNLAFYGVLARVEQADALELRESFDAAVTDVPYGRSTKNVDRGQLYPAFLEMLKKNLKGRAVVVFPHYSQYEEYVERAGLTILAQYEVYVHRTLTRKVVVLSA